MLVKNVQAGKQSFKYAPTHQEREAKQKCNGSELHK